MPNARSRDIIHLDMDAFYASVEVLDEPSLRGKPVIVGGCSDRGVVSAASYEARAYGVHSAMPIVTARRLCPHGVFLPVRMARYKELSQQVMAIFSHYTPLVEPISVDEAFLDVSGCRPLFGSAEEIARTIKERVRRETGLTVSGGVASSKLVAKIASDLNKPDGLTIVPAGQDREFLADLPISKLWGVGKRSQQALNLLGVQTIGDLSRLPRELLESKFGKHGLHLYLASRGLDDREVTPEREVKSVGHEETFETDLRHRADMERELLALAVKVGRRLRRYQILGKTVTLKVKYRDFNQVSRSRTLSFPTDDHRTIFHQARNLLAKTEAGSRPVRLLGITLANLTDSQGRQMTLFRKSNASEKYQGLNEALDVISNKYGSTTILPATLLMESDKENPSSKS